MPMEEMGFGNNHWWECIIDNKFVDYQDQRMQQVVANNERSKSNYWYSVDVILGFSFDETTKASCKKIVKVNQKTGTGKRK